MSVSGTIVYCSREDHAPPQFAACLARLAQRHPDAKILHIIGNDIADSRNSAVMQCEGDWVWFIDTDMLFAPTTLERLLDTGKDAVQVLCLMRHPPNDPLLYQHSATERDPGLSGPPRVVEVQSLGAGGTLYRKAAFEAMPGPWFEGIIGREDTSFAQKLRDKGIRLYVDMSTPVVHLTPMGVRPKYEARTGTWTVEYVATNGVGLSVPFAASPPPLIQLAHTVKL